MIFDVLCSFDFVLVCSIFNYKGNIIDYLPYDLSESSLKPVYKEFKGWSEDLRQIDSFENLPENLNYYIKFLEKELEVPIVIVSVGPDRKETLFR